MSNLNQTAAPTGNGVTTKTMLFKEFNAGTSKKSGNEFRMVVLHDPLSLDNISFFLDADSPVSVQGLQLRDKVVASFGMEFRFGRLQPVLIDLKKAI